MSERDRLTILGSGFAALSIVKKIDLDLYDTTVISPRNHFLFTPLLPSTTVGTIEFRSIIEPIRRVRKGVDFIQGGCVAIDPERRSLSCQGPDPNVRFQHHYQKLVIAVGATNNTFGIPGVEEHAVFLKELTDARIIRERIVSCLEGAAAPGIDEERKRELLHFVVVGGGPTGVEFAAELRDLLYEDLSKSYPGLLPMVRITLFEAMKTILSTFDAELQKYTMQHLRRHRIDVHLGTAVAEVGHDCLRLQNGEVVRSGLIVWSTGNTATSFIRESPFEKRKGRLVTDDFLRVPNCPDVFALGDCATIAGQELPQTAQVAMQAGKHLARQLNRMAARRKMVPFRFRNMGMLAYIGEGEALADIPRTRIRWRGEMTYLFWRSAYLTRLVSTKNKVLVLFDWIKTAIFGRDLSKF